MKNLRLKLMSYIVNLIMILSLFPVGASAYVKVPDIKNNEKTSQNLPLAMEMDNAYCLRKLKTPENIKGLVSDSSVVLTWDTVKDAALYEIEIDGNKVVKCADTKYTDGFLQPNSDHIYRIKAKNSFIESEWSSILKITTQQSASIENTNNKLDYSNIGIRDKADTSVSKSLISSEPYLKENAVSKLTAPKKVISIPTLDSIILTWTPVSGAEGYQIEEDGKIVDSGFRTTYIHDNLQGDSKHTYRVRALNKSCFGEWSEYVSETTLKTNIVLPQNPNSSDSNGTNTSNTGNSTSPILSLKGDKNLPTANVTGAKAKAIAVNYAKAVSQTAATTVVATAAATVNSTVSPVNAIFDNNNPSDIAVTVDNTVLTGIYNGTTKLVFGTDQTTTATGRKIFKSYLAALPAGTNTITFYFSNNTSAKLTINVKICSPTNLIASSVNDTSAVLNWSAPVKTAGITG